MDPLKYARVERERRWLLAGRPNDAEGEVLEIEDRYLLGTRLRLREVTASDGTTVRKLGHKVRLEDGPDAIACTSLYLDVAEWDRLVGLPAVRLSKRRTRYPVDGGRVVLDEFRGGLAGLVLAEIDGPGQLPPDWPVVSEVTNDERYTGGALATAGSPPH